LLRTICIIVFCALFSNLVLGQQDRIEIVAQLDMQKHELKIQQQLVYHNQSSEPLDTIYLLNWPNSFLGRKSPLAKRLIEDYDKSLYFAKRKDRGHNRIEALKVQKDILSWSTVKDAQDLLRVVLNQTLAPNDSLLLKANYTLKIPSDRFTRYGVSNNTYNLRDWHFVPAVFDGKWHLMSNLNLDDFYMRPTDYKITFLLPPGVRLNTDLEHTISQEYRYSKHILQGKKRVDSELNISVFNDFKSYKTDELEVLTNLNGTVLNDSVKKDVLNRQLLFIREHLGSYPHQKILVNRISYDKNPIYGLNQLPKFLNPFTGIFEWDIKMFKVLTRKYLENTILVNRRDDIWLLDGIQTYLMMQYVETYYPEIKALGNISKIWGVRSYSIAKLDFNDKYPFVYQFAARKNLDQALSTRADSLSNFNRKIVNKYKAGIGLRYLDEYLKDSIIPASIKEFYQGQLLKETSSAAFKELVLSKTTKDLSWFFGDYVQSKKKIDYTISKVKKSEDSLEIQIKNKRNFSAPIALYGVKDKETTFKKWLEPIDSTATIKIAKGDYTKVALNYDYQYPEFNLRDNWKNLGGLFNKPVQLRFFKDIENPFYNQAFYNIFTDYNFYDGLLIGPRLYNEALFKKKWLYKITPLYGVKSRQPSGSFSLVYEYLPEETSIYRYRFGFGGSTFNYAPNLRYTRFTPFAVINFKRKSLRDVGGKALSARYLVIDRETEPGSPSLASDRYNVLNIRFNSSKPDIIQDIAYSTDFQYSKDFSKLALDFRYRKLTNANRQFDFRLFAGTFIHNDLNDPDNFFSFGLDRPSDYLFDYDYLGRSEESGFLSQQIIIAEGGFKSQFENRFANQWMLTANGSIGIWRWVEFYADAGFYKSKGLSTDFKYDSGIRLNFVHNILEVYFPLQSSLGFEPSLPNYDRSIRFVLTLNPARIYNFIKRGFY